MRVSIKQGRAITVFPLDDDATNFKVIKARNTLSPTVTSALSRASVEELVRDGVEVNIVARRGSVPNE